MTPETVLGMSPALGTGAAVLLCMVLGYLLGSVNTGILITKAVQHRDIRAQGSGNAGMTNVIRTVGKKAGVLTFVGDFLKCVLACLLALTIMHFAAGWSFALYTPESRQLLYPVGAACVVGHMYPLYFKFQGGKGVVTASAMMLMADWRVFLLILATFLLLALWKRIISLGSVVCAALFPVYALLLYGPVEGFQPNWWRLVLYALLVGLLCLWKHRGNIQRLLKGEEKPLTSKKEKTA